MHLTRKHCYYYWYLWSAGDNVREIRYASSASRSSSLPVWPAATRLAQTSLRPIRHRSRFQCRENSTHRLCGVFLRCIREFKNAINRFLEIVKTCYGQYPVRLASTPFVVLHTVRQTSGAGPPKLRNEGEILAQQSHTRRVCCATCHTRAERKWFAYTQRHTQKERLGFSHKTELNQTELPNEFERFNRDYKFRVQWQIIATSAAWPGWVGPHQALEVAWLVGKLELPARNCETMTLIIWCNLHRLLWRASGTKHVMSSRTFESFAIRHNNRAADNITSTLSLRRAAITRIQSSVTKLKASTLRLLLT